MEQNFETCLYNVVDAAKVQKDEPMKKHTTFRIGGPADYFIMKRNWQRQFGCAGNFRYLYI